MARKLASVVRISRISPIANADSLDVAEMAGKGWRVVVRRGEFSVGDLAVYFEIDSFLDPDDARYAFLRERCLRRFVSKGGATLRSGIRIKTVRLRGVISQGLLMPLSEFGEIRDADEGTDLTEALKVEHYDEVAEMLRPATGGNPISADAYGKFPSGLIPKTDEERIQNLASWFDDMRGRRWEVTAKFDGSSLTAFYSPTVDAENPFGVCSRNLRLKEFKEDGAKALAWSVVEKYAIPDKLRRRHEETGDEWALQMELVGPGVNGDRDKYLDHRAYCFRIWDIRGQRFVSPAVRRAFCAENDIPHVQVIADDMPFFDVVTSMDDALRFAEGKTTRGNEREGVVLKTTDDGPFASCKIVSNKYLMKSE